MEEILLARSDHIQRHDFVDGRKADQVDQVIVILNAGTIEFDDHVSRYQLSLGGGRAGCDRFDESSDCFRQPKSSADRIVAVHFDREFIIEPNAEIGGADGTVSYQLTGNIDGQINGDREANAFVSA